MLHERRSALIAILLISGVFLGFGLFANIPALYKGFLVADQAVYYIMAQSLAFDGDLEYTARDLIRYNEDYWAGPNGVFLKKVVRDGRERLFYAKSFAYALFAAPFVRILGPAGPIVFNGLMLFLLLLMGWNYFSLGNSPGLALGKMAVYLGASVAFLYALWITPEFFNMFLVFSVLFLWRYKAEAAKSRAEAPAGRLRAARDLRRGRIIAPVPPLGRVGLPGRRLGRVGHLLQADQHRPDRPAFSLDPPGRQEILESGGSRPCARRPAGAFFAANKAWTSRVELPGRSAQDLRLSVPAGAQGRHLRQRTRPAHVDRRLYQPPQGHARPAALQHVLVRLRTLHRNHVVFLPGHLVLLVVPARPQKPGRAGSSWPRSARSWSTSS